MNTLVVIITHQGAQALLDRNWPWWVKGGYPLTIVEHADKPSMRIPTPFVNGYSVQLLRVGTDPDRMPHRWVGRFMAIMEACSQMPGPTDFCFIEADGIFTRPLPPHPGGLVTTLAGHKSPGFRGHNYYHTPWWMDRKTMGAVLFWGRRMLNADLDEAGFIDRFIGLMELLYDLTIVPASSYSQNSLDQSHFLEQARAAIAKGAYYVHGVKTQQHLDYVTAGL